MRGLKIAILTGLLLNSLPIVTSAEPRCVDITGNFTTLKCATLAEVAEHRAGLKAEKLAKPNLRIGMSAKYVLSTGWGDTKTILDITTVETRLGVSGAVIYKDGKMLYFSNGILESISN